MAFMKAVVKNGRSAAIRSVAIPVPGPDEVRIRVRLAGLCRTDVQAARGLIPTRDGIILGHEFSGEIDAVGRDCPFVPGDRVAVQPVLGCRACEVCVGGDEINCPRRQMLGVDRDGAFAEFIVVPVRIVHRVPASVSWAAAAYAEPIAAALAVLDAGLSPRGRTLLLGRNRFSRLLESLLRLHGHRHITLVDSIREMEALPADSFDQVIETTLDGDLLTRLIDVVRPRGLIVLKSRHTGVLPIDVSTFLRKQTTLRGVNYGSFHKALALLVERRLAHSDWFGQTFALEEFADAMARDERGEATKLFLAPGNTHVRNRC